MRPLTDTDQSNQTLGLKVIAVIPAYNESKRIASVLQEVAKYTDTVIVVNDGSTDDTALIARENQAYVIDLKENKGAGNATREGCLEAIYLGADIILTIDADGQHDPREIPRLLQPLIHEDIQIVFGGRPRNPSMPIENRLGNHLLSKTSSVLLGITILDTLTGFRAFHASVFEGIVWQSNRYSFVSEMVFRMAKSQLRFKEVPVSTIYHDNKKGMRKRDGIKTLFLLFWWKIAC
jgi:glycosyltransferase involved in cell wall biosynthesis